MGITSNRNSSSDKVRKELQSLNSKLSTSMSYLQVEDEISFLEKIPVGKVSKYEAREKHFDKVLKLWFKGLLLEHELLVEKGKVRRVDRDTTTKAYLKFADVLRVYLVELGILKFKKSSGGLKVALEGLYSNVFKDSLDSSSEEGEKDKKKKYFKNEKELEELMNNDNNLERDRMLREAREKELGESKEKSDSKETSVSKGEKESTRQALNLDSDLEIVPKEKAILGVDSRNPSAVSNEKVSLAADDDIKPDVHEATIYGKNAYMMMQGQINNLQAERINLEMERQKMNDFVEGNKNFFKELQDFKRQNDKGFLNGKETEEADKKAQAKIDKDKLLKDKDLKNPDKKLDDKNHLDKEHEKGLKENRPKDLEYKKPLDKPKTFADRLRNMGNNIKDRVQNMFGSKEKTANEKFNEDFKKNQELMKELNEKNKDYTNVDKSVYEQNMRQAMMVKEAMELQETDLSHYEKNMAEAMEITKNNEQKEPQVLEPIERQMRK